MNTPEILSPQTDLKLFKASHGLATTSPDINFVRFEGHLLRMGYFGSGKRKEAKRDVRLMWKNERGTYDPVLIQFIAPEIYGLPTMADQDRFMGFVKIVTDRATWSRKPITNPIEFTGAELLSELGQTLSGKNYEAINTWGKKLQATVIHHERTIFNHAHHRAVSRSVSVFRAFECDTTRSNGDMREDKFRVVLEDWVLDNLTANFVVAEDFMHYRELDSWTAKGLFGQLHVWFANNGCKPYTKDYGQICSLLDITQYTQKSRVLQALSAPMDELKRIGYISNWSLDERTTQEGYKVALYPGKTLIESLQESGRIFAGVDRTLLLGPGADAEMIQSIESLDNKEAYNALLKFGVTPAAKAKDMATKYDPIGLIGMIEYTRDLCEKCKKIKNPPGFMISLINKGMTSPPDTFITTRKARELEAAQNLQEGKQQEEAALRREYEKFRMEQIGTALRERFPEGTLSTKLREIRIDRSNFKFLSQIPEQRRDEIALVILKKEIEADLCLPTCEEWCKKNKRVQYGLFNN